MKQLSSEIPERTVGLDLGDRRSVVTVLDRQGRVIQRSRLATERDAVARFFSELAHSRVVMEAGTQSPWVDRLVAGIGHETVVGNPRQVRLISESTNKSDGLDSEMLARLGRVDPQLLRPIQHRGEQTQADRALLRVRDAFVQARSRLILTARGLVKPLGYRLPSCSTAAFAARALPVIPEILRPALEPLIHQIGELTRRIKEYDRLVEAACKRYPETVTLRQVRGVGALTALAFVTAVEDPTRFDKSREAGPFFGLVPRRDQSGSRDPRLGITKGGDDYARRLLVQAAHYILGPFGPPCSLREYGERIVDSGGRAPKPRAIVAVARKLAVLLHRLWVTGHVYDPWHGREQSKSA